MKAILIYIMLINLSSIIVMGIDKHKAQKHKWRISERSIFIMALLGGGLGVLTGMSVFRHKTKQLKFTLGIPAILVLNIIMFAYLLRQLLQIM